MSTDKQTHRKNRKQQSSDFHRLSRRFMSGLLRSLFLINTPVRAGQTGFVLPTTVLLLLMVTLTAGALSFRSFSRTQAVITQRQQEVIVGAAAPAIDRAKAKIEYLFAKDVRFPGGLPTSNKLQAMMKNVSISEANGSSNAPLPGSPNGVAAQEIAPYTLPGEERLNLNGDSGPGSLDNAWSFQEDIDNDGNPETIVYSILIDDAQEVPDSTNLKVIEDPVSNDKAQALVTRNASIDTSSQGNICAKNQDLTSFRTARDSNSRGWEELDKVTLLKNFQIDVLVVSNSGVNRAVSTSEFQQVRQATRANKWGAWFKNDIELFPGPGFVWNGAMHTEGSLFLGNDATGSNKEPKLQMISAHASCLYPDARASEITLSDRLTSDSSTSFQGQFVVGKMETGYGNGDPIVDWFLKNAGGYDHGSKKFDLGSDSVQQNNSLISDVALDPIQMFTADISRHRNPKSWKRDSNWENNSPLSKTNKARVINENENTPFLDDLYRADNRYGPKAAYTTNLKLSDVNDGKGAKIGTDMRASGSLGPALLTDAAEGLDGYWERQAIKEGMRIIGGQRLELGNNTGWKGLQGATVPSDLGDDLKLDPLYNEALSFNYVGRPDPKHSDKSIRLHRLSLRDNLAAVQSMAVYHANAPVSGGKFPLMCMSMTSHPGTEKAIERSTSFYNINGSSVLDIDFFNGFGTNGWEYAPPMGTEAEFKAAYNNSSSGLRKALRNLAYFAGDPNGGAPSFTPVQDGHIHPYPTMSMWGDFSHLRHLVDPQGTPNMSALSYDELSPADQSYLHTAACTLGMLADNIKTVEDHIFTDSEKKQIVSGISGLDNIPNVGDILSTPSTPPTPSDILARANVLPTSPHAYIYALENKVAKDTAQLARMFHLQYQIKRDRAYGFAEKQYDYLVRNKITLTEPGVDGSEKQTIEAGTDIKLGVNPADFGLDPAIAIKPPDETKALRLAALAGGIDVVDSSVGSLPTKNAGQPKYPSLFYLFPEASHDHFGDDGSTLRPYLQPKAEPYIDGGIGSYVSLQDRTPPSPLPNTYAYQNLSDVEFNSIVLTRKDTTNWVSPYVTPTNATANKSPNKIRVNSTIYNKAILLLDKGFMDGREMMSSRSIDIDVFLATKPSEGVDNGGKKVTWIAPDSKEAIGGIVYAFREDAKREDSIVRPVRSALGSEKEAWATCSTDITKANCLMAFDFNNQFDPPLRRETGSSDNYISPKPVDYFADPMRRPYGFRLSNGASLNRPSDKNNLVSAGLSFISDNVVYIRGNFNLHQNAGGTRLEEFKTLLADDNSNFYSRTGVNNDFADLTKDKWRPVEVIGDAVGILSDRWNDGATADIFQKERFDFTKGGESSYQNYLRPEGDSTGKFLGITDATDPLLGELQVTNPSLFRENPYDAKNPKPSKIGEFSPVRVWRDGEFKGGQVKRADSGSNQLEPVTENLLKLDNSNLNDRRKRDRIRAQDTVKTKITVNALIITGVVPSRLNQTNGGLHNFPRMLEHWRVGDKDLIDLNISGGFFQLNFSTSATGPYDQRANVWEPTSAAPAGKNSNITYYGAPGRKWGYDVALQFVPAGPISRRFVTIGAPRSEYYQEIAADDPYIRNLQCAKNKAGKFIVDEKQRTVTCNK